MRFRRRVTFALAGILILGCRDEPPTGIDPELAQGGNPGKPGGGGGGGVATVEVTITPSEIVVGATAQATAVAKDRRGNVVTDVTFTWSSSDQSVATVDASSGVVTGVAVGTATITASTGGKKAKTGTAVVTVVAPFGLTRQWVGGDVAGPTDWGNANNWSPTGIPTALDTAIIPTGAASMPLLGASTEVGRVEVLDAATLGLAGHTLTVWRDLESAGEVVGPGLLALAGTGGKLAGAVPNVLVTGSTELVGPVMVLGDLTVRGGSLSEKGYLLRIRSPAP